MSNTENAKIAEESIRIKNESLKLEAREKSLAKAEKNFNTRLQHHEQWRNTHENINFYIDKAILASLYFLLLLTTSYALINVSITLFKAGQKSVSVLFQQKIPPQNANVPLQNTDPTSSINSESIKADKTETLVLETVEHIFLYLLPLFIILGFFHYYKNNARYSLVDKSTGTVEEESSTKSMNITKVLFVSSIISYVIIKIIEKVLIEGVINPIQLTSYGILLLLLITFYLFLIWKNH